MANRKSAPEKPKKRYVLQFSWTSLLFSGIGGIVILAWVFALGIIAGRGSLDTSLEGLFGFKGKAVNDEHGSSANQEPPIKEEELTFYNQLIDTQPKSKPKPPLTDMKPKSKPKPQPQAPPSADLRIAKRINQLQEEQHEARGYRVQVAALKDRETTEKTVARLLKAGYPAYYRKAIVNGEIYYRIRCGPFRGANQAKGLAIRLREKEGFKPFILHPDSE
jgi:cell division septation protein DedD